MRVFVGRFVPNGSKTQTAAFQSEGCIADRFAPQSRNSDQDFPPTDCQVDSPSILDLGRGRGVLKYDGSFGILAIGAYLGFFSFQPLLGENPDSLIKRLADNIGHGGCLP